MSKQKPTTYEVPRDGEKVRVTIPDDPKPSEMLTDAIRENLSPHAVAAIAAYLQPAHTNNSTVDREVQWFTEQLAQTLGGPDQQNRLAEELGL